MMKTCVSINYLHHLVFLSDLSVLVVEVQETRHKIKDLCVWQLY